MSESSKRHGRPPTFDRLAALDIAVELFWRHGYEGTSIAMLTEGMGVTAPTIYAAFGSKEGLYLEGLARYRRHEQARWQGAMQSSAYRTVETSLRKIAIQFADPTKPKGCMVAVGLLNCSAEHGTVVEAVAAERNRDLESFITQVEQAKLSGEVPPETNAEALARFYAAVVEGMSVQAIDGATAAQLDGIVDMALAAWPRC